MNGLELSRAFYEECGRPMLEQDFPRLLPYLAAGLFGSGSECLGYDDECSQDHDFEPGFCLFLPGEDTVDRRSAFLLERAYARLPRSFRGYSRSVMLPVGGARHGVLRTAEFFLKTAGTEDGRLSTEQWLTLPEQALLEATNGELFFDSLGEVTQIRDALRYFPEDVRRKRLAGQLLLMAQAGQYNFERCLRHGETGAAQLAACEFVNSALAAVFLLNRRYRPYYKWSFRALRALPALSALAAPLEVILSGGSTSPAEGKKREIEQVASAVAAALRAQELTHVPGNDLERHAYAVNDRIADPAIRNLHILAAV
ncbi:MAG: DUF4037 domain-containing protein [Oscillospiraceae bacterium]|nr:DUF4037 domain-containing protein [Oscillospiraceae bacterium]